MTWTSGTATNSFDLFDKLRTFLTVALPPTERWTELYHAGDYTTAMAYTASQNTGVAFHAFDFTMQGWYSTDILSPQYLAAQYDQAVYVTSVTIVGSSGGSYCPNLFHVQYSDDGLSWFTQDTIPGTTAGQWASSSITFALSGGVSNAHKYWRLKVDTVVVGSYVQMQSVQFNEDAYDLRYEKRKTLCLRGQGGGSDQIFVNLDTAYHPTGDYYNLRAYGATGYNSALNRKDLGLQPGANTFTSLLLFNSAIPYWFIGNGRRFIVVAKVNTTYHALYAGFILPYATPVQYPYPLAIGGSCDDTTGTTRWSATQSWIRNFYDPGTLLNSASAYGSLKLRFLDGTWYGFANWYMSSSEAGQATSRHTWPYCPEALTSAVWGKVRDNVDGSYTLFPVVLFSNPAAPSANVIGELQGVFAVPGFNNSSENTVTISGVQHLVIPNVYRTGQHQWAAIRLE